MYSLLLVDDEPNILNGLYQNVDWDELGIDKVYKASFGTEALQIIRSHHIDIVITDIRMPEMDGVKLAEEIGKNWPYTIIIFLTGYQDFKYAQMAVDLGVYRYVLKPVMYGDIVQVVQEALAVLAQTLADSARIQDMEETILQLHPVLRERAHFRWLEQGDTQLLEDPKELQEYNIPIKKTDWGFLLMVKTDAPINDLQEASILHLSIRDLAREILAADGRMLDYSNASNYSVLVLLHEDEESAGRMQSLVVERLVAYQHALSKVVPQTFTLFWTATAQAMHLHEEYALLKGKAERHITLLRNSIIGPDATSNQRLEAEMKSLVHLKMSTKCHTYPAEKEASRA